MADCAVNPVVESCRFALEATDLVQLDEHGIADAATYIRGRMKREAYSPRTWRTQPLHLCPPEPYAPGAPGTRATLDWLFLVSALNFSFWSPLEGTSGQFAVEWRASWARDTRNTRVRWTGYYSLLAAINRAIEDGIPLTDPAFYASAERCPDALLRDVFRGAPGCVEPMPLLDERIAVMRACGRILCKNFGGSFQGVVDRFQKRFGRGRTALDLVRMVVDAFPAFQDEVECAGRKVYLWKRAQILVAETWAAFFPPAPAAHPLFPRGIGQLTMFADYRVPQVLHHLRMLAYPRALADALRARRPLASGCREEVSIRAASVLAVERVREVMVHMQAAEPHAAEDGEVSSVLIDFYLWDLAQRMGREGETVEGTETEDMLPAHRTRSIWY